MKKILNILAGLEQTVFVQGMELHKKYADVSEKENKAFGMLQVVRTNRNKLGIRAMSLDDEFCRNAISEYDKLCDESSRILNVLRRSFDENSVETVRYNQFLIDAIKDSGSRVDTKRYVAGKSNLDEDLTKLKYEMSLVAITREKAREKFEKLKNEELTIAERAFQDSDAEFKAIKRTCKVLKARKNFLELELAACNKAQTFLGELVTKGVWRREMKEKYFLEEQSSLNIFSSSDKNIV